MQHRRNILSIIVCLFILLSGFMFSYVFSSENGKRYTLAVLDLKANGVSEVEAIGLSDKLRSHISRLIQNSVQIKDRYELIERTQMGKIFDQFEIQNTGCVSDSCAIEFGKMLQANRIVIGTVSLIGQTYSIIARIVDIESGKTIGSADRQYKGAIDDVLISVITQIGNELLTGESIYSTLSTTQTEKPTDLTVKKEVIRGEDFIFVSIPGKNFEIGVFEVVQSQYKAVMGKNPSYFRKTDKGPVEKVSWYDAVRFCNKLSDLAHLEKCYYEETWDLDSTKNGFRLPTEDEWEYACRAGTNTKYYAGDDESSLSRVGWYYKNSNSRSQPVGEKEPNVWGLYDMHGNVWEWCSKGVLCGGSWYSNASECCSSYHKNYRLKNWEKDIGFRIIRSTLP